MSEQPKPCTNCGHCPTCGHSPAPYWRQWPGYYWMPMPNVPTYPTFISTATFSPGDVVAVSPFVTQTVRK